MPKLYIAYLLLAFAKQGVQHRHAGRCTVVNCQSQQARCAKFVRNTNQPSIKHEAFSVWPSKETVNATPCCNHISLGWLKQKNGLSFWLQKPLQQQLS
jgi:hypothetical protein